MQEGEGQWMSENILGIIKNCLLNINTHLSDFLIDILIVLFATSYQFPLSEFDFFQSSTFYYICLFDFMRKYMFSKNVLLIPDFVWNFLYSDIKTLIKCLCNASW